MYILHPVLAGPAPQEVVQIALVDGETFWNITLPGAR